MQEIVENRAIVYRTRNGHSEVITEKLDLNSYYTDDEIVVQVHAAALNPLDLIIKSYAYYLVAGNTPKTFSSDFSGVIVRKGKNVQGYAVGDKVVGCYYHIFGKQGSLCNYLTLDPKKHLAIIQMSSFGDSEDDDFVLNAAWPLVFGTAYMGLGLLDKSQNLGPDSRILVIGASTSVSNALVQIAKNHLKVKSVVGICSKSSFERNKELGFDHLVAYDEGPVTDGVKNLIDTEFNGGKFDLIFDSVGNSDFIPRINEFLKPMNENSYYRTIVGDKKLNYSSPNMLSGISLSQTLKRSGPFKRYNYKSHVFAPSQEYMKLGVQMIASKQYKPSIDSVFRVDEHAKAFNRLLSNRAKGKVVIKMI
ncbi:LAFE_0D00848g1_1 [Lachancea fermentati]|uniref:LAFE_0D00848g1_1 n=1 Tax=Lachancea fermentati TaxID=4955 RepID=A0A1G4MAL0_LACFM|nr:LAFE_0D00848g1_1 [Lachancea fermentati]